ncbi:diacylglycerol/lipid kinase family protein [Aestuariivirga sp.]|uniref:diacylglycerol/lipid kinase family protein n=1 Tax=Aestuariivirga sp. TaxID=2650926 RepID=UPI0039E64229
MTSGVLINPKSGRGNGKGVALAEALKSQATTQVHLLTEFGALEGALRGFAKAGVTDLFISSGDGTVQAIQTLLAETGIFPALPRICLLPHGTTNMTAADIGYTTRSIAGQAAFIANPMAQDVRRRATVKAVNPRDGIVRHGMFLGTGAASAATRYTQVSLNDKGVKGNFATFAALAGAVSKSLFSAPNPHDFDRFDRPFPLTVRADGELVATGTHLLALATTLDKLILGTKPFWGGKTGPIRLTTFPYPVPNLFRWFLPAIMGGEDRTPPPGAASHAVTTASIESTVEFVIDGEFFDAPVSEPLRIETGPEFSYIIR